MRRFSNRGILMTTKLALAVSLACGAIPSYSQEQKTEAGTQSTPPEVTALSEVRVVGSSEATTRLLVQAEKLNDRRITDMRIPAF